MLFNSKLYTTLTFLALFLSVYTLASETEPATSDYVSDPTTSLCNTNSFNKLPLCDKNSLMKSVLSTNAIDSCDPLWQIIDKNGKCQPKFYFEACGSLDWSCDGNLGDKFRLTRRLIECKDGVITKIILPTKRIPDGNIGGLATILIEVYACTPITKFPPQNNN